MKAAQISDYGDASVIHVQEVEKPTPGEGQVLIEVYAASLNPFDTTVRAGYVKEAIPLRLPVTLGGDVAGVVVEVGLGATGTAVGDRVYGQASAVAGSSGAFAEYTVTKTSQIAKAPSNLDFQQVAALPLVGVSALQALERHLELRAGQKIFIHGGAGGIGVIAVQIAKHIGAYVAATATGDDIDYVKKLGADEVVDYKLLQFKDVLHDFDSVFDTVGGEDFKKALDVLRPGGKALSMVAKVDKAIADQRDITVLTQSTRVTSEILDKLRGLAEAGVVVPRIGAVFSLEQVQEAFKARESGKTKGKIILKIR